MGRWALVLATQDIKRQTSSGTQDVKRQIDKSEKMGRWVSVRFVGCEGFGWFRFQMTFQNGKFLRFGVKENLRFGSWETKMQI